MWGVGSSDSVVCIVQPGWLKFSLIFNNHLIPLNTNKVFQSTQLFIFVFSATCFSSLNRHWALLYEKFKKKHKYICSMPCQFSELSLVYKYLLK